MSDLPKGWVETTLGDIAKWSSGGTPKRSVLNYYGGDIPWVKTGDLNDGLVVEVNEFLTKKGIENSSAKVFPKGSIALAMYGATIGRTGVLGQDSATNQACAVGIPFKEMHSFLHWLLKFEKQAFIDKGKGGAQPNISQTIIKTHKVPLPPLGEQNRMVAKLDVLFGELEALKNRLANIPELLKNFKQAVLTQAVAGKLTAEWRLGKDLGEWEEKKLNEIMTFIGGGTPSKSNDDYWSGDIPWASVKDFKSHKTLTHTQDSISQLGLENSSASLANIGELLLITRMSPGRTIITEIQTAINQDLKIVRPKNNENVSFISFWFTSNINFIESISTGTTVKGIRVDLLKKLDFKLPPKEEQEEIVRRVEGLFAQISAIEKSYEQLKSKTNTLPQAILAKAFRGELVEQLDSDGSAAELLEEIKALKEQLALKKKSKRKIKK